MNFPDVATLVRTAFAVGIFAGVAVSRAEPPGAEDAAFFESKVKPVLVQRCYECHSHEKKIKGGLALDSREAWQAGGDSGKVIVPGDAAKSLLIRAVEYQDEDYEMPPKGKLPDAEIAILREWVQRGAPDPRSSGAAVAKQGIDLEAGRQQWAFRLLAQPAAPEVRAEEWETGRLGEGETKASSEAPRLGAIDAYILEKLAAKGLKPAPASQPERFLRRLSYDLTGLPPTPEELRAFLGDLSPSPGLPLSLSSLAAQAAIERATDRLLASPAFGEKWGRHWLDVARYADSNGSSFNPPFPQAWRYRNWVIAAHNADLPYPEFIAKQLAGDLLPYASPQERDDNLVATGYLMLGSKVLGEFDKEQLTLDVVDEQIDTITKSMLGLTVACARCHDHKFDPVPQRDYYALAGILTSTITLQDRFGGPKEDESDWSRRGLGPGGDERLQSFLAQNRYEWIRASTKRYGAEEKVRKLEAQLAGNTDSVAGAYEAGAGQQRPGVDRAKLLADLEKARAEFATAAEKLRTLEADMPPYAEAVAEGARPADEALRIRGVPASKGDVVPRGFLQVASWSGQPQVNLRQSGRLELAQWIGSPQNPLTARVHVNRVWMLLFGEGIVRSVDNFGPRGDTPTHPELLDHLAQRFIAGGWRLKPLLRELVTSRAYRMGTQFSAASFAADPENKLLWRQNKRRLTPEEIRDTLLVVSGQFDAQPAQTLLPGLPMKSLEGGDAAHLEVASAKRTIYQPIIRTMEYDIAQIFDFAPTAMTTGQRPQTTVAPQALYFLNAPFVQTAAKHFAEQLAPHLDGVNIAAVVREAYTRAIGRAPSADEQRLLCAYLETQFEGPPGPTLHDLAKLCQALLGSTQFQFLD